MLALWSANLEPVRQLAFGIWPRRRFEGIGQVQSGQKLSMHRAPFGLVLRPSPSEEGRTLSLQTVEETTLSRRHEQDGRSQQGRLAGEGDRLRDDAVVGGQFAVERSTPCLRSRSRRRS